MSSPTIYLKQAKTTRPSMGLEELGLSMFEGASMTLVPGVINGVVQHGLVDKSDKESKTDIEIVERHYGRSLSKREDVEFWAALQLTINHTVVALDIKNGEDLLKLGLLRVQGHLAPSVEVQDDPNEAYKFVIYNEEVNEEVKTSLNLRRLEATDSLKAIYSKEPKYLIALCRYLINYQGGVKTKDAALNKLLEFIEGKLSKNKGEAVDSFINALDPIYGGKITKEEMFIRIDVEDAIRFNILRHNKLRGEYYNAGHPDSMAYGTTKDDVVRFLMTVSNGDHLGSGAKDDVPYSIRYQLAKLV